MLDIFSRAIVTLILAAVGFWIVLNIGLWTAPIWIPLLGWFFYSNSNWYQTNKARRQLKQLHAQAEALTPLDRTETNQHVYGALQDLSLATTAMKILDFEDYYDIPDPPADPRSIQAARYKDHLNNIIANRPSTGLLLDTLIAALKPYAIPYKTGLFDASVPLSPDDTMNLCTDFSTTDYFPRIKKRLQANYEDTGYLPTEEKGTFDPYKFLRGTPLTAITERKLSVSLTNRFEHAHILGGCLHPNTPIYDPVDNTTKTVFDRYQLGKPFHVFSVNKHKELVIGLALPPQRYTKQPMLRLSNGRHSITVTHKHRVWLGNSFCFSDRLQSAACHLPTIEEHDLKAWRADVQNFLRTGEGSLYDYRLSLRLCGQQPLSVSNTDQDPSPSPTGVLAPCSGGSCMDVLERTLKCTHPYRHTDRPSKQGSSRLYCNENGAVFSHHATLDTCELPYRLHPLSSVFDFANNPLNISREESVSSLHPISLPYTIQCTTWTAEPVQDEWYYDFHVLDHHNYYACGAFHHNTGAGKTQLIQYMISKDLEEDCTVIVIDNQRQMIPKLAALGHDMQLLSPNYPLSLNLFDMPRSDTTAPLLRYVLSGLMGAPLTAKQAIVFQFAVDLMLHVRGNINTFHDLLNGKEFDFTGLDETPRRFFETEFYTKGQAGYQSTRQEISWRVWALLTNPILRNMFAAQENKCALELNRKLILIDCDVDRLQDYSGLFGRFFIAQLLQIAQSRFIGDHKPVYVYIDECYYYLDDNINSMLETARKAKLGLTLAHQYLGQVTDTSVSAALSSLTSTKFAAQLSPSDRYAMAQAMRIKPEYLDNIKPLHFALARKNEPTVTIEVPVGTIENMPQHPIPHDEMIARYGRPPSEPPPIPPASPPKIEEATDW